MQFPSTLTILSSIALLATSVAAVPSASFDTWNVNNCQGPESGVHRYQRVEDNVCRPLPDARRIRVYWTRASSCRINTYSGPGCTGTVTQYRFEADNAPCLPVDNKVAYRVTC